MSWMMQSWRQSSEHYWDYYPGGLYLSHVTATHLGVKTVDLSVPDHQMSWMMPRWRQSSGLYLDYYPGGLYLSHVTATHLEVATVLLYLSLPDHQMRWMMPRWCQSSGHYWDYYLGGLYLSHVTATHLEVATVDYISRFRIIKWVGWCQDDVNLVDITWTTILVAYI